MPNGYRMSSDDYKSFCKRYGQLHYNASRKYASLIRSGVLKHGSNWLRDALSDIYHNFKNRFGLNVTEMQQIKVGSRAYRRPRVHLPEVIGVIGDKIYHKLP